MRILLVQTAFLGDLVLSTPVVDALKQLYPGAEIDLLTTRAGAELFAQDPRFSHVIAFEKPGKSGAGSQQAKIASRINRREGVEWCVQLMRRVRYSWNRIGFSDLLSMSKRLHLNSYDRVYTLHRSFRTSLLLFLSRIPHRIGFSDSSGALLYTERRKRRAGPHAVHRFLSLLDEEWVKRGWDFADLHRLPLTLYPGEESLTAHSAGILNGAGGAALSKVQGSKYTVIVPGSAWKTKQWHWRNYRELASKLHQRGIRVVLAGSAAEHDLCEQIRGGVEEIVNLAGQLSLPQFVRLVYQAAGLICNDSFALHVGSAAQVPTVAVFCATSPSFGFGPWQNPRSRVVEKLGLWCKPCRRHGGEVCPTGTEHCMRTLSADEVLVHCIELFTGERRRRVEAGSPKCAPVYLEQTT